MQVPNGPNLCPDCGYSLVGLPAVERCPECGCGDVGEKVVLVWGFMEADVRRVKPVGKRRFELVLCTIAGLLFISLGVAGMIARVTPAILFIAVGLGFFFAVIQRARPPEPTKQFQLRFTPVGYGLRRGIGRVKLIPWSRGDALMVVCRPPNAIGVQLAKLLFPPPPISAFGSSDDAAEILRRVCGWITVAVAPRATTSPADSMQPPSHQQTIG